MICSYKSLLNRISYHRTEYIQQVCQSEVDSIGFDPNYYEHLFVCPLAYALLAAYLNNPQLKFYTVLIKLCKVVETNG